MRRTKTTEGGHSYPPRENGGLENPPSVLGLPDDWQVRPIKDGVIRAKQRDPRRQPTMRFRYVDVSSVSNSAFRIVETAEMEGSAAPSRARKEIRAGDVLFATVRPTLKRVALVPPELDGQIASTGFIVLRADPETLNPRYLYNRLLTDAFIKSMGELERGASYPAVRDSDVLNEIIPLPPLPEQRKIAGVLGVVQRAMEQQERLLALTAELKKTLLHQLFTQGLRGEPLRETEIGPVPQSWELVTLQNVCSLRSGGTPSKQKPEFWLGSIPWVSPKDMKKPRLSDVMDHISEEALEDESSLAPAGAVFVVIRGMILAKDVPVALAEVPMAFNQDMKAIIPGPRIHPSFLLYALVAFKQRLFEKVGRSAHGTMTLMSSEIAQFAIPLPDKATQQEIASGIETAERKHGQHQHKHAALTALFRTLLHELMTAQLRVHDLDLSELAAQAQET
jgi:type I restriction enzyme S subunit